MDSVTVDIQENTTVVRKYKNNHGERTRCA